MQLPLPLSIPCYWELWYTIMSYSPVASSSTLPLVDFLYCVICQGKLTSPCTQSSTISLIIENWCKQPVVFLFFIQASITKLWIWSSLSEVRKQFSSCSVVRNDWIWVILEISPTSQTLGKVWECSLHPQTLFTGNTVIITLIIL